MFDLKSAYKNNLTWIVDNTVVFGKAGSHSYGLATPSSDEDFKGIAIAPPEYYHGFMKTFEQAEQKKTADSDVEFVIYEIRKFFNLAASNNPNIMELLWLAPEDYLIVKPLGERILAARDTFLSKQARYSFAGYAFGQLKRIKSHRAWLLNPPKKEPKREDFGLPKDKSLLSPDQRGALDAMINQKMVDEQELSPNFLAVFSKEKAYHVAKTHWDQYMNWKKERNVARAELEAKYGYDCKHASHLVRLMRMCREILTEHRVIVKRPDRDELLSIKNGAWSYDQLIEFADREEAELDVLYETSTLRKEADRNALDKLCAELVEASFK